MRYIYRVENEEGFGCYYDHLPFDFIDKHTASNGHPRPQDDIKILRKMKRSEICGFLNLNQAEKWFTPNELLQLEEEGFYLGRVKVKEITAIGESQVLAIK